MLVGPLVEFEVPFVEEFLGTVKLLLSALKSLSVAGGLTITERSIPKLFLGGWKVAFLEELLFCDTFNQAKGC
jgi:hypothetical protein